MLGLRDVLAQTQKRGVALGHFNVSDLVLLKAVSEAARELKVPVLVGASEGEHLPIFLNADHTHSLSKAVEAASAQLRRGCL